MSKPAILIIEDSASLALGFAAQLEEAGDEVALAATLAEARDALANTRFSAALLDRAEHGAHDGRLADKAMEAGSVLDRLDDGLGRRGF